MKRSINIDIIKVLAVISVIGVHFFLNNNFYTLQLVGNKYYLFTLMQNTLLMCVPLFIIATGYLMSNKKDFNRIHIKKLLTRIIIPYIFIGLICVLFDKYYLKIDKKLIIIISSFFDFSAAKYGWYVGMYAGLYLLIPFLNKGLESLSKKEITYLIIILFIIGPLSSLFKFRYENVNYFIITNYYYGIWMFNYYIIGYYVKRFNIKLKIGWNLLFLLVPLLSLMNFHLNNHNNNSVFYSCNFNYWGGLIPYTVSVLVFMFFISRNMKSKDNIFSKILANISNLTLSIYLFSYIFDQIVYKWFPTGICNNIYYFPIIVLIIFIFSYISSLLLDCIIKLFYKVLRIQN